MSKESKSNRDYNVFFNTHTVSGIVISVGLYIIFFAGAFAIFTQNINRWETNTKEIPYPTDMDYEKALDIAIQEGYELEGRSILVRYINNHMPHIQVRARALKTDKDHLPEGRKQPDVKATGPISLRLDPVTYENMEEKYNAEYVQLGTFLYQLHFLDPIIPTFGIYISGLISLFFLFAILTGLIIHWNKIISNFFTFRLRASVKNLWTDGHTALGVIGFPFQFMYAVTGCFYGLSIVILLPSVLVLFDGDRDKMFGAVSPTYRQYERQHVRLENRANVNELVQQTIQKNGTENLEFVTVTLSNYLDENAHASVVLRYHSDSDFFSNTYSIYKLSDGSLVEEKKPDENTYHESVLLTMGKLHFAEFGGYLIKSVYFILALLTCFVILSGVMIWLAARDKKIYEDKRKFNQNVGAIYIGSTLGLYPAIALMFLMTKVIPMDMSDRYLIIKAVFFVFWAGYTVYAFFIKNTFKINRNAMYLAGAMGILIPFINGISTGLWFWRSLPLGYVDSFYVDFAWLIMGVITLLSTRKFKPLTTNNKQKTTKGVVKSMTKKKIQEGEPVLSANTTR
ncbi:MAG: PepSY domain-containing protein [Cytophagales bacterium]|nr:PepSY domain-containing protein [Cytophagales bacterium]